jgi:hypothetical protein
VDRHQGGKQCEGEEERGSQVNHSLSPYLSTPAQRTEWNFDPFKSDTVLKLQHVHDMFGKSRVAAGGGIAVNPTGTASQPPQAVGERGDVIGRRSLS